MTEEKLESMIDDVTRRAAEDFSKNKTFTMLRTVIRNHAWDVFRDIWNPYGTIPTSDRPEYDRDKVYCRIYEKLSILHVRI